MKKLKVLFTFLCLMCIPCSWAETYVKKALSEISSTDVVLIVCTSHNKAMSNNNGTSSAPAAVAVTITDDKITTSATNIQWNISNDNGTFTVYVNNSTNNYLYCINNNNGVRVGSSNSNKTFVLDGTYLKNVGQNRFIGVYNSSDWRCYTSKTTNIDNQEFAFFVADSKTPLSTPTNLSFSNLTTNSATLSWDAVEHASCYTLKIGDEEIENVTSPHVATGLDAATQYTWTVKAIGDETNYSSSSYAANVQFTTPAIQRTVNWYVNGGKTSQVVDNGSALAIPGGIDTDIECGGKTFVGWCTDASYSNATTAPTGLFTTASGTVTADANYYAVFATASSGGAEPVAYTVGATGDYVLAVYSDSKWYALPNNPTVNSGKIAGVEITVGTTSSSVNYVTTTNASGYTWTIANATNGQTISDGTNYIYHSNGGSSGTNLAYGNSTSYTWKIESETNGLTFKGMSGSTVNSRGMLASGTSFGGYALSNEDASGYNRIQVLPIGGGTTYTDYLTECTTQSNVTLNVNGGTINSGNIEKYSEGTGATLPTDVTKIGFKFGGWFDNEECKGIAVTTIGTDATGAKEFWAKWSGITPTFATDLSTTEVTYTQNDNADELVVAANETFSLSYQWQKSANNSDWSNISGATMSRYTPSTIEAGTLYYRCVVTNIVDGAGSLAAMSNSAMITVNALSCSAYSLHYGTEGSNPSDWNILCFGGEGEDRTLSDFVMPDKPNYWVGWAGIWNSDYSHVDAFATDLKFTKSLKNNESTGTAIGSAAGAVGTLHVANSWGCCNKRVSFDPAGYGFVYGEDGSAWSALDLIGDNTVLMSGDVTLTEPMLNGTIHYYIGIKADNALGYVWSDNSQNVAMNTMGIYVNSAWIADATIGGRFAAGDKGKIRIWSDNFDGKNWKAHFVPYWTLRFDANGKTATMPAMAEVFSEETSANRTIALSNPTNIPDHVIFDGWYTQAEGGENVETSIELTAHTTLYAHWSEEETHEVRFYVNGEQLGETQNLYNGDAVVFPAENPADIEGKKFQGWMVGTISGTQDDAPGMVTEATMGDADITYHAVFAKVESSTVYKLVTSLTNGKDYVFATRNTAGSGYALSSSVTTGTSVTIAESGTDKIISGTPANTIIWTAATGWSLTNKGVETNNKLAINGSTFAINETGSSNLSWTTNYGLNGQSGSGTTKYFVQCTNTGTFSKSTTTGSTTNRVYAYEKTTNTNYSEYATHVAKFYDVKFYTDNGETLYGETVKVEENTFASAPAVAPEKTGYIFTGWSETFGGEAADLSTISITAAKNFYAVWTPKNATITFNPAGGNWDGETANVNKTYTYDGDALVFPANPQKDNYDFMGWYDDSQEPAVKVTEIGTTFKPESNLTLTAHWQLSSLTLITLVKNTEEASSCSATFNVQLGGSANVCIDLTKTGYDLVGFFDENDVKVFNADGTLAESATYNNEGNWAYDASTLTVAAKWRARTYTITYNNVDPSEHTNPANLTIESAEITLIAPDRDGYAFKGWYGNSEFEGDPVTTIATGTHDNVVLWAKWVAAKNVAWMVNGVALTTGVQDTRVQVGEKVATLPEDPTNDCGGKVFVGWAPVTEHYIHATDAPANMFKTAAEAPVVNDDVTYYAVFANVEPDSWTRVTDVNQLSVGKSIIFGYEADHTTGKGTIVPARNEAPHTNNYIIVGTTEGVSSTTTINMSELADASPYIYVLRAGYNSGYYALENAERKYITHAGKNAAKQADAIANDGTTDFLFEMNGSDGEVTITNKYGAENTTKDGSNNYNFQWLGYNTSSPRFALYRTDPTRPVVYVMVEGSSSNYSTKCRALDHIVVDAENAPKSFYVGDEFSHAGATVTAHFDDETTKDITAEAEFTTPAMDVAGDGKTVTVSYEDKETSYTVDVKAITLTAIEVTSQPTRTVYGIGNAFDVTGMTVMAHYNDSRKDKVIALKVGEEDGYTISPATFTTKGEQNVTLTYGGMTVNVPVTVNTTLTGIRIATAPTKTTYTLGEALDLTGLVVVARYDDASEREVITYTTAPTNGATLTAASAPKTITVSYTENDVTKTNTFDVVVNVMNVTFISKDNNTGVVRSIEKTGAGITPPAINQNVGIYTFCGWSETNITEETTDVPTLVTLTDGKYFPTEPTTLYAVYTAEKDGDMYGKYYYINYNSTKIYIAPRTSSNVYFGHTDNVENALTIYEKDGYLFYTSGAKKYYFAGKTNGRADLTFSEDDKSSSEAWTIAEGETVGTYTYQSKTTSRYLAYNTSSPRFATYGDSYPHEFYTSASSEKVSEKKAHYTSNPSAAMNADLAFSNPTTTVIVDQRVTSVATSTNSTGAITYASSDETVASVNSETGEVTGIKAGTVRITATIAEVPERFNSNTAYYDITVNRITTEIQFLDAESNAYTEAEVYADTEKAFTASSNSDATITYSLSRADYATVDAETGIVTFKPATDGYDHTVTLYARQAQTDKYTAATNDATHQGKVVITIKSNRKNQTVQFAQASYMYEFGATENLSFTNAWASGMEPKTSVTYASNNTAVAGVNATTGEVTVHSDQVGTATITATVAAGDVVEDGVKWAYQGTTATYTITVDKPSPNLAFTQESYTANVLVDMNMAELVTKESEATGAITWSLSATTYATIDAETGVLHPTKAGNVTVYADIAEANGYKAMRASATITINDNRVSPELTLTDGTAAAVPGQRDITLYINAAEIQLHAHSASNPASMGEITYYFGQEYGDADMEDGYFLTYTPGTYYVKVTIAGTAEHLAETYQYNITVLNQKSSNVVLSVEATQWNMGKNQTMQVTNTVEDGYTGTVNYVVTPAGATYDSQTQMMTFTQPGIYTLTATAPASGDYVASEASVTIEAYEVRFTYDLQGGTAPDEWWSTGCDNVLMLERGDQMTITTGEPTRTNYQFDGWFDAAEGGNQFTVGQVITIYESTTIYAHWTLRVLNVVDTETATISEDVNYDKVVVQGGGTLAITTGGTLSVDELQLTGGLSSTGYDMPRIYIAEGASLTKTQTMVNLDLTVDNRNFYPFAVPFPVAVSAIDYVDPVLKAASVYRKHYVINTYDGARRAEYGEGDANWRTVAETETLQPGVGYIIRAVTPAGDYDSRIRIPMTVDNGWTTDGEQGSLNGVHRDLIPVTAYTGSKANEHSRHSGWNFVANPYLAGFAGSSVDPNTMNYIKGQVVINNGQYGYEGTEVVYVSIPTYDFSEYIQIPLEEAVLRPECGFFVQVGTTGTMNFQTTGRQPVNARYQAAAEQEIQRVQKAKLQLMHTTQAGTIQSDKTGLTISNRYTSSYEVGADLEKMFGSGYTLAIYTLADGTRLAYNAMSQDDAQQMIPVGYRAPEAGEYTFQLDENMDLSGIERLELVDYHTGDVVNLLTDSYTFQTEKTQDDERFAINVTLRQNVATGLENQQMTDGVRKQVVDGMLYILRDGKWYDAVGTLVK